MKEYERFTPLRAQLNGLPNGYSDVTAGDCIVAFSRREIYEIKQVRDRAYTVYHPNLLIVRATAKCSHAPGRRAMVHPCTRV